MAVSIRSISMDLGPHCIYLCLKTGLEIRFVFKRQQFKQASKFFKPDRTKITLRLFSLELSIEVRRLLD